MITKEEVELNLESAKNIHSQIIVNSGGQPGVRDEGGLYNSLAKVLIRQQQQKPFELCAFIYREFAIRHHFNDGNKRFSHVYAKIMLLNNNYHLKAKYKDALPFIIAIADGRVLEKEIQKWISDNSELVDPKKIDEYYRDLNSEFEFR